MMQELVTGLIDERKLCIPPNSLPSSLPRSSASSSPASSTGEPSQPQQNLRCPRCDSPNTKFCYYNNYNLTQPRHFCKTCRRYWTKGGALRNVPIGGGCRKAKTSPCIATAALSAKSKPPKTIAAELFARSGAGLVNGLIDNEFMPVNSSMFASSNPAQLLALLKSTSFQNFNPTYGIQSKPVNAQFGSSGCQLPFAHINNNNQCMYQQQGSSFLLQELLSQKMKASSSCYYGDEQVNASNVGGGFDFCSSTMANSSFGSGNASEIMEPAPISAADVGYWNSWADLPTIHGALP